MLVQIALPAMIALSWRDPYVFKLQHSYAAWVGEPCPCVLKHPTYMFVNHAAGRVLLSLCLCERFSRWGSLHAQTGRSGSSMTVLRVQVASWKSKLESGRIGSALTRDLFFMANSQMAEDREETKRRK